MPPKQKSRSKAKSAQTRRFESEAAAIQSLRLIAAPNPKDDLTKEQIAVYCRNSSFSAEIIQQLIEYIKNL
jgi:hypothetical protein